MPDHDAHPGLRIGDAEREHTEALLRTHVGDGRLDLTEFESRLDAVHAARTQADLDAVTRDLPVLTAREPVATAAPTTARPRIAAGRAAAWAPWALVGTICLVMWLATSVGTGSVQPFWPAWVIGPWGALLLLGTLTGRRSPCPAGRTGS
ncbi:DUF1707 domain-containing protein [Pseudonocardia benzenivorans]|uniref:DUF1707 domain-containing protein n=2 Tax=Pseudonocardia TaxID=1847 RepID=F4CJG7_PSEUX|nr:DUF1707 domain-containing protein [Pseudonocardia dioxanivorans]AEA24919.1 protein of unknown function DUF1707 [Pseudonocardia dioxanivorans CB1190]GJF01786.1 hypothetical protein PSD17_07500 [Pseudonocardia sp. D17]